MTAAGLSNLVVEVLHNRGDDNHPDWSVGSGFFVGTGLVLTALHNVDGPGELLVRVHGTEEHSAVVRLQGDKDIVDLAAVEVSDVAEDVSPLRYGAVDRSAPTVVERCWAVGFPRFKERVHDPKPLRLSAQVNGEIPTGENLDQSLLTLQVRRFPRPLPSSAVRESEWAGMSGATVFSGDNIIVGVITEHHLPEGESALAVVPITALDLLSEAEAAKWWKLLGVDKQALVRLPGEAPSSLSHVERQNRTILLKRVREIWIDGVLDPSLHQQALIALDLQDQPDALDNPWHLQVQETNRPPRLLPAGTSIVQVYDEADGRLLILGKPGVGKTTLLLALARVLLERAERDRHQRMPVPVVFHLSSWAEKCLPLHKWLIEELWTKYTIPHNIGKAWVNTNQILPLLDGLDEVAAPARPNCVQAINTYCEQHQDKGPIPIVVCCRRKDYLALPTRVKLTHAVSIRPLTSEQIDDYLQHVQSAGNQLEALSQALHTDRKLCVLARYPLMLSIFTLAYQRATWADLPTEGVHEARLRQIFGTYVQRMLTRRQKVLRQGTHEQFKHWLFSLASQMQRHNQTTFSVESLQPDWLSRRLKVLYDGCCVLFIVLVRELGIRLVGELVSGLLYILFIVVFIALFTGGVDLYGRKGERIKRTEMLAWSWKVALLVLVVMPIVMLIGMLGIGLIGVLVEWLKSRLVSGPVVWLLNVLLAGLGITLACMPFVVLNAVLFGGWWSRKQLPEQHSSPNEGIWHSGKKGLIVGSIYGLIFGLVSGLIFGLASGLFSGLVVWLGFGLGDFFQHFLLRLFLSRSHQLPWKLVPFLDEAADRLLLRKVGGDYIFVHRELLDYFASLKKKES